MRYYCSYMNNANLHLCPAQESYEFTTIIDRGGCVAFMAPVCLVSCLPGVLSASCPVCFVSFGFVSCLPGVLSAWCPVCLVSCLPGVLSAWCPVCLVSFGFVSVGPVSCRPRVLSARVLSASCSVSFIVSCRFVFCRFRILLQVVGLMSC